MQAKGTKIQFTMRTPTPDKLKECPHVIMTSPRAWNPQEVSLSSATAMHKESIPAYRESFISKIGSVRSYECLDPPTSDEALLHSINPLLVYLKEQMSKRTVKAAMTYDQDLEDTPARRTYVSTEQRHLKVTAEHIAEFGIGPERAKATLRATTQRGI
jgi:hypothetical protein